MREAIAWFFRDRRTGAIVIGQWPNLPLWLFAGFALAHWFVGASALAVPRSIPFALDLAARASLAWWALDELFRGVNPWRRCLGGAILIVVVWGASVALRGSPS